jgi:hypothetical protein
VNKADLTLKVICGLAIILLASCSAVDGDRAAELGLEPADCSTATTNAQPCGFRLIRACGYELVYEAETDVYNVVGLPECYYRDGSFYSLFGDGWRISDQADGNWRPVALGLLPPGLQKKVYARMYARILTNNHLPDGVFARSPF